MNVKFNQDTAQVYNSNNEFNQQCHLRFRHIKNNKDILPTLLGKLEKINPHKTNLKFCCQSKKDNYRNEFAAEVYKFK